MRYQDTPPLTIEAAEIASGLRIPKTAILRTRAGLQNHPLLRGLPSPLMTRPRLVWLRADIDAWLDSRRTFRFAPDADEAAPPRRGPGRPRKLKGGDV